MPLAPRALAVLIAVPLLTLVAGILTLGGSAGARPVPHAGGAGCAQHTLRFGVTDDAAELGRQNAFERGLNIVTKPGFYTRPTPSMPTLHAASHSFVVVFYRPDVPDEQLRPLRALAARGQATKAPVIVAPRRQGAAVTGLGLGRQLTCTTAGAAQTARVRAFAAAMYPALKP